MLAASTPTIALPQVRKVGAAAYELDLPPTWTIHQTQHEVYLTPYIEPFTDSQRTPDPPPPEMVDFGAEGGETRLEYAVKEILNSRKWGRGMEYLVSWEGYGPEENTWEPPDNLTNAQEAIADFHKRYPDRVKPNKPRETPTSASNTQGQKTRTTTAKPVRRSTRQHPTRQTRGI